MAVKVTDVDKVERTLPEVKEVGARIEKRVGDEAERATQAEQALRESLSEHGQLAEEEFQKVNSAIESETSRAQEAEAHLQQEIASEVERAEGEESRIESLLQDEVSRAKEAESALSQDIEEETNRAEQAEASLTSALSQEQEQRILGDTTLDSKIDKEIQDRESGDSQNSQAIQAETSRAQEAESTLQANIDAEENRAVQVEGQLSTRLTSIEEKIPNQASATNQLADKAFVNSSIQQMAANRVTYDAQGSPFPTRAILLSSQTYYHNGAVYTPDEHDYALVTADEGAPTPFTGGQTRFEWTGSGWEYAYGINERPFTSEEWAAIESGVTAEKVAEIGTKLPMNTTQNSLYGTDSGGSQIMVPRSSFATSAQGQKADTAYQKPEGGIPKADLESSVQSSLEKADTALQGAGTFPNIVAGDVLNVTGTLNGKSLSSIFESDGTTAKTATNSPKSLYNLGAYDTFTDNGDGTATITRKTYTVLDYASLDWYYAQNYGSYSEVYYVHFENVFDKTNIDNMLISNNSKIHVQTGNEDYTTRMCDIGLQIIIPKTIANGDVDVMKAWLNEGGNIIAQIPLVTSYTEKVILDQPIHTLDVNGEQFVRDEWEKGLNLLDPNFVSSGFTKTDSGYTTTSGRGAVLFSIPVENGAYTVSIILQQKPSESASFTFYPVNTNTNPIGSFSNIQGYEIDRQYNLTVFIDNGYLRCVVWGNSNNETISFNMWFVEGSHAYPYQSYNGAIVHEKELNDALEDYPTNDELNTKLEDYLPLSGGTMTGTLNMGAKDIEFRGSDPGDIVFRGGDNTEMGRIYGGGALNIRSKSDGSGIINMQGLVYEKGQRVYSPNNPPTYPVTSVDGKTGDVQLSEIGVVKRDLLWSGNHNISSSGLNNVSLESTAYTHFIVDLYSNDMEGQVFCMVLRASYSISAPMSASIVNFPASSSPTGEIIPAVYIYILNAYISSNKLNLTQLLSRKIAGTVTNESEGSVYVSKIYGIR